MSNQDIILNEDTLLIRSNLTTVKSSSFNRTVLINDKTKEVLERLIWDAARAIPEAEYWRQSEYDEYTKTARNLGLNELADKLTLWT